MPMTTEQLHTVLQAIYSEFVTVRYDDPLEGGVVTKTMYSNNVPSTCMRVTEDGQELWDEISFPLIER
ncbi:MAG: hypothetical protein KBS60_04255, partial [Phascolarctobacterium sp.]|nr:hypothetical protein [Candidatus Phascolarctobacterium caballi]